MESQLNESLAHATSPHLALIIVVALLGGLVRYLIYYRYTVKDGKFCLKIAATEATVAVFIGLLTDFATDAFYVIDPEGIGGTLVQFELLLVGMAAYTGPNVLIIYSKIVGEKLPFIGIDPDINVNHQKTKGEGGSGVVADKKG